MKEGYSLIIKVRSIFREKMTPEQARIKLHEWYKEVSSCTLREIKSARDCIKAKEEYVLNVFVKPKEKSDACIGYALARKRA